MDNFLKDFKKQQYICNKCQKCKNYPLSPWDNVPEECLLSGWLFQTGEKIKQNVRKQKELLLHSEIILKKAHPKKVIEIKKIIRKLKEFINTYEEYGSKDW